MLNAILTGQPLSKSLAPFVVDADGNTLTYVKDFGPSWLSVSSAGVVSGTPAAVDVGISDIEVSVSDGFTSILVIVRVAVYDGTIPAANLLGRWKLNEGSGAIGAESGGGGLSANLLKVATGGLGTAGNAWAKDPVLGNVFTAAGGVDGASATVGDGPGTQLIPAFFQSDNFSWTFYARTEQGAGTQIILGNRFGTDGLDTVPREFVKFTNNGFEWHFNGAGENIDYPVLPMSQWHHHAVVKLQDSISYYRDGKLLGARKITGAPFGSMPLYFAGQNGLETWRGALSDVRIYNGALQPAQVAAMITDQTASALGLNILSLNVLPTTLSVLWRSDPGVNYRVEQSTTMASGSWTPAVASVASQGFATQTSVARPAGAGRLFLRVVQLPLVP